MIRIIRIGGIKDLIVVLGSSFSLIKDRIADQEVKICHNLIWEEGISSSIKAGLMVLDNRQADIIFFIVDQPFLSPELIGLFIKQSKDFRNALFAVKFGTRICHPVLFSVEMIPELLKLEGDKGGKTLFKKHPMKFINWTDRRILVDIDTQEDVNKLSLYEDYFSPDPNSY